MGLIRAPYLFLERYIFNTLLRKILGCILPLFAMLLIASVYTFQLTRALKVGLATATGPEAAASLALLAKAEMAATILPILAALIGIEIGRAHV